MRQISLLIKPASSLCNMRCSYCFYKDEADLREQSSMGIMNNETIENLVKKVLALDVMQVNFCFQGGEPTLAKIDYFHYFIDCVNKYNNGKNITYAIQTNGLALNDSWFNLFKKHHFLVGISLDGFIENHDKNRCDILNKGTFNTILKNIKRIDFLPFHRLGREKYLAMNLKYPYEDKQDMDKNECDKLYKSFTEKYNKTQKED